MKRPRVDCKKCGRPVIDDLASKWRHIAYYHADLFVKELLVPLLDDPERARHLGKLAAEQLKKSI